MNATLKVNLVTTTHECDNTARSTDVPVKLRLEVVDALMAARGITSVAAQARAVGVHRSHLFKLRNGEVEPLLGLAMKIASVAGTTVEAVFEVQPAGGSHG